MSENAEAQWGLKQCHTLARRALNAQKPEKRAELLGHILRICEQQSAVNPTSKTGVLRGEDE